MSQSAESLYLRLGARPAIDRLVAEFYGQARLDPMLGPVFAAQVHDWPSHMVTVAEFWTTQTGGPRLYRGGMGKHIRLGLQPQHFAHWLGLWQNITLALFGQILSAELTSLARVVAERLQEMAAGAAGPRIGR
jgi:hemoglobin